MSTVFEDSALGDAARLATRASVRLSDLVRMWPDGIRIGTPLGADDELVGVTDDSRDVRPGWLFVAIKGFSSDGHTFIPKAIEAGAAAVVCERLEDGLARVPHLVVKDGRKALGLLLSRFHRIQEACRDGAFQLLGVTGTKGKTTCAYLMQHLLNAAGMRCGRITTIDRDLGCGKPLVSSGTTPPATVLYGDLAQSIENRCLASAMEVSSHGLDQDRVAGLPFAVAVFTNLTGDHLDYHKTMDNYAAAKSRLFTGLAKEASAVVNMDDPYCRRMVADCKANVLRYSLKDPAAEIYGIITDCDFSGLRMTVHTPRGRMIHLQSHLVGRHNAQNILACVGAAMAMGIDLHTITKALETFQSAPGRFETVGRELGRPFRVIVDYCAYGRFAAECAGSAPTADQRQTQGRLRLRRRSGPDQAAADGGGCGRVGGHGHHHQR